jgi:selenocysteine-specific elongation factor
LSPPDWERIAGTDGRNRGALERLIRAGILVRTVDRVQKRTVIFHRDAVLQAACVLREALATRPDGLLAGEAGAMLGISRKFSIPLLEHFDRTGLTRRHGDRRHLARVS